MSAENLTMVVSAIGIVLTLGVSMFAGFSWCVRRIDAVDHRLGARVDAVDHRLGARVDALDHRLGARIDALAADVTELKMSVAELKVSVARLEGPPRRLYLSGR